MFLVQLRFFRITDSTMTSLIQPRLSLIFLIIHTDKHNVGPVTLLLWDSFSNTWTRSSDALQESPELPTLCFSSIYPGGCNPPLGQKPVSTMIPVVERGGLVNALPLTRQAGTDTKYKASLAAPVLDFYPQLSACSWLSFRISSFLSDHS